MSSSRSFMGDANAEPEREQSHLPKHGADLPYGQGGNPALSSIIAQIQAQDGLLAQRQAQSRLSDLNSLLSSRMNPSLAAAYAGVMNDQLSRPHAADHVASVAAAGQGLGLLQSAASDAMQASLHRQHLGSLAAGRSAQPGLLDLQQQLQLQLQHEQSLHGLRLPEGYGDVGRSHASGSASDVVAGLEAQRSRLPSQMHSPQSGSHSHVQQGRSSGSPDKARESASSPVRGTVLVPCRARGMPMDHNFKTAHFVVPEDIEHGADLICSYNACRNAGIKFRFCTYCQVPVAKRNFRKRHMHGMDVIGDDDEKDDDKDKAGDEDSVVSSSTDKRNTSSPTEVTDRSVTTASTSLPPSTISRAEEHTKDASSFSSISSAANGGAEGSEEIDDPTKRKQYSTVISDKFAGEKAREGEGVKPKSISPIPGRKVIEAESPKSIGTREEKPEKGRDDSRHEEGQDPGEATRLKRWHDLLNQRPATDDNEAMSRWLIQVLSVSDRSKPFKSGAAGGDAASPLTVVGANPQFDQGARSYAEGRDDARGENLRLPKFGPGTDVKAVARSPRPENGRVSERVASPYRQHEDDRGAAETAAAEAMAALPQLGDAASRLDRLAAQGSATQRMKRHIQHNQLPGRKRTKDNSSENVPLSVVPHS